MFWVAWILTAMVALLVTACGEGAIVAPPSKRSDPAVCPPAVVLCPDKEERRP